MNIGIKALPSSLPQMELAHMSILIWRFYHVLEINMRPLLINMLTLLLASQDIQEL